VDTKKLRKKIRDNLGQVDVVMYENDPKSLGGIIPNEMIKDVYDLLKRDYGEITNYYEKQAVGSMMWDLIAICLTKAKLDKDFKSKNKMNTRTAELVADGDCSFYGKLPEVLSEQQLNFASSMIIFALANPASTYGLIKLPKVQLGGNLKINDEYLFIGQNHRHGRWWGVGAEAPHF